MDFSHIPHKNLVLSTIIALSILGGGIYFKYSTQAALERGEGGKVAQVTATTSDDITERDSDNDGLPDWEENLHGSDPFNADTDGDRTNDGEEFKNGRSPTVPGPNDKLELIQDPHFATSSTDLAGLRKEFFAKFLAAQGDEIRETTYRDLIAGFDPKKYQTGKELVDLNIGSDNSLEGLRAYGNAFGAIINKYKSAHKSRAEEEILADGLKTKSDATLKELQLPAIVYKNFSEDLRVLLVPSDLAAYHLLIVNGYDGMGKGLLGMQHLFSDPIDGAGGYQVYTRMRVDVTTGYAGIVSHFGKHNVTFTADEPGYPFYWNTMGGTGTTAMQ